jgi:hypothetical protein
MLRGDLLVHFAEIEAGQHANALGVQSSQRLAREIAFHERIAVVIGQVGRVIRHNPADVEQGHIGLGILECSHVRGDVHAGVNLAQVGLDQAPRRQSRRPV